MASKQITETIGKFRNDILNGKLPYGSLLPSEKELAENMAVSRPTIAKIYNTLKEEGLIKKTPGYGTTVVFNKDKKYNFGLLLPGSVESEIFGIISDHFLAMEKENRVKFLWDGAIANNAEMRQNTILRVCEAYIENKVDGVFFAPLERTDHANVINKKVCEIFDEQNIPIMLIDRDICYFPHRSKYNVIWLDNFNAGYEMTKHLIERGCEKIYFFNRKNSANSVDHRMVGCYNACFEAGISFSKSNIVVGEPTDIDLVSQMEIVPKKTGILCTNDATAAALMASINQLGINVSVDLLIAGFDDMKYSRILQTPLTTYRQPLAEIVKISYELMLNRISNPNAVAVHINLIGEIIIRESTQFR